MNIKQKIKSLSFRSASRTANMSPAKVPAVQVLELGDDGRHAEWILYRLPKGNIYDISFE